MTWIQLRLRLDSRDLEVVEPLLQACGALAITCQDAGDHPVLEPGPGQTPLWPELDLTVLFPAEVDPADLHQALEGHLSPARLRTVTLETLEDRDWERSWLDDYRPMQFSDNFWVCPASLPPPDPAAVNLRLDPGLAFGTGTHPTTALCLDWLAHTDLEGRRLLDYGCGSGILAIAGLLLGARQALATDIDSQALEATRANAAKNAVATRLQTCPPDTLPDTRWDLVLANILAGPLLELAPVLADHCAPGGTLLLSGILEAQAEPLTRAYGRWFRMGDPRVREGWVLLAGTRHA